ncbi:hypothetical protein OIU74_006360 [Salix koriyanagi]|uniref:Uncharacterized protein n=1 Tax=Salix koriyanagi TaxID=2511006 RepID=A0A9Q0ZBF6_9ROSI|nr:hypothetical protein OIU74_006360 [Salix koriyanagi]
MEFLLSPCRRQQGPVSKSFHFPQRYCSICFRGLQGFRHIYLMHGDGSNVNCEFFVLDFQISIQEMGLSHLIQRSITKKLLPSKPSNIISSSWFLADTTAKSFDLSGGSNGAKINYFDGNDRLKISKSSYHVSSGGFKRGVVFWEPNMPVTIEEF